MVRVKEDLTGAVFDRLTVMYQTDDYIAPNGKHMARWHCRCSCKDANEVDVLGINLKSRTIKSCGCWQRDRLKNDNEYDISGEYAIGYTTNGEEYWVDKEDLPLLKKFCWYYNDKGYLVAKNTLKEELQIPYDHIYLHKLIMGGYSKNIQENSLRVDHKRHPPVPEHKIDNRKENLRIVTIEQNNRNKSKQHNNKSGVIGIHWDDKKNGWIAQISVNNKKKHIGIFANKEDAIEARIAAEIKYFGDSRYGAYNN